MQLPLGVPPSTSREAVLISVIECVNEGQAI